MGTTDASVVQSEHAHAAPMYGFSNGFSSSAPPMIAAVNRCGRHRILSLSKIKLFKIVEFFYDSEDCTSACHQDRRSCQFLVHVQQLCSGHIRGWQCVDVDDAWRKLR